MKYTHSSSIVSVTGLYLLYKNLGFTVCSHHLQQLQKWCPQLQQHL